MEVVEFSSLKVVQIEVYFSNCKLSKLGKILHTLMAVS